MKVVHLLRKPCSEGTVAANVLRYGTGALNIDATRIAHANPSDLDAHRKMVEAIKARGGSMANSWKNSSDLSGANDVSTGGRWPANLVLQHLDGCVQEGVKKVRVVGCTDKTQHIYEGGFLGGVRTSMANYASKGTETVPAWVCAEGCPVAGLDAQSGVTKSTGGRTVTRSGGGNVGSGKTSEKSWSNDDPGFGDTGGASRFFKQVGGKVRGEE